MGIAVWLACLALCHQVLSIPIDTEDDIPPYLRGMEWRNVEKELQKDLRLDPSVRPIAYGINLNVSVRGYGGAKKTTFDGVVSIAFNTTAPTDSIELHSVGLNIKKVEFHPDLSSKMEITKIEFNQERETVIFTLPKTLHPTNISWIDIHYNGTAAMRSVGLYEYWTDSDKPTPADLPTISLATSCEPTGARRWFPCFDEPDKKAFFGIQLTHPSALTAYSNNAGDTIMLNNGVNKSSFYGNVPLPTYVVALALTAQPVVEVVYNGQKIRAIGGNPKKLVRELKNSMDDLTNRPVFKNVTFFPEKTDWLVANDFLVGAMENPGLIISNEGSTSRKVQIHELAHMYFGNLVTLRSWEQIWINEGFADFFQTGGKSGSSISILNAVSIHEPAMHTTINYARTNYLTAHFIHNNKVHYSKAGQLIRLIKKFVGEEAFDRALNRYLRENSYGNGDSEMMIDYLSRENSEAREILRDWVYKPGVALLSVNEETERVIIQQRRFLRTDFIEEMRDDKSRWTIPLYYKINGVEHMKVMHRDEENFIIDIPANCSFSIVKSYPYLYAVHYVNRPEDPLSRIVSQTNIHQETVKATIDTDEVEQQKEIRRKRKQEQQKKYCEKRVGNKSADDLWNAYFIENNSEYLTCDPALKDRAKAMTFLRDLLLTDDLPVRTGHLEGVSIGINLIHPGILKDLLSEEHQNYPDSSTWRMIIQVIKDEKGALDELRRIVRDNPSFAANFYYTITNIFEEDFIKTERAKRKPSLGQKLIKAKKEDEMLNI